MKTKSIYCTTAILLLLSCPIFSQNINMAKDLYRHNLKTNALKEFISIYNSKTINTKDKSEALFYMGQIAFDKADYNLAMDDWRNLVKKYPKSSKAIEIKGRLLQLSEVFSASTNQGINSSVAKAYIKNGDFWSKSDREFSIDNSWMPNVELAIKWYDKVISEFPNTHAAEIAYQRKLFTILGWKETGVYGNTYGIKGNHNKYINNLISVFNDLEKSFPNNQHLQGFRYQIAQVFWGKKDWDKTRLWLNKVIDKSKGRVSFYSETAKARLQKIKY